MVTNLSNIPSSLTVIPIPNGDVRKHRDVFIVNENLKRMGCSGRAGINLQKPQASTEAKFHLVYRTSEMVPLFYSVMELVKLCQTALNVFGKLQQAYVDGLLCDKTEEAINQWWADIGSFFYNIEPTDGMLGPTTVAGLLGLLIGAHNRLNAVGTPAGKDVLDIEAVKRAVGAFQRMNHLERTRRLDRQTLDRLHRNTAKNATSNEKWTKKAVKSTVAELGGKGGEMLMGFAGARDKVGIAEVETLDLDHFIGLATGPRMRWLWHGKPIKSMSHDSSKAPLEDLNGKVFSTDDQGGFLWTSPKRDSTFGFGDLSTRRTDSISSQPESDGRSGLGKIKDAVGLPSSRPHVPRQITEDLKGEREATEVGPPMSRRSSKDVKYTRESRLRASPSWHGRPSDHIVEKDAFQIRPRMPTRQVSDMGVSKGIDVDLRAHREQLRGIDKPRKSESPKSQTKTTLAEIRVELEEDKYQSFQEYGLKGARASRLRRSRSAIQLVEQPFTFARQERLPRNLSFTVVEPSILRRGDAVMEAAKEQGIDDNKMGIPTLDLAQTVAQKQAKRILGMQQAFVPYVESLVGNIESLDQEAGSHLEDLNNWYYQRLDEYQIVRATGTDVVADEKGRLTDTLRRLEGLGAKLDYELTALQSRIQEVEDGVSDFERSVVDIEAKVKDLTADDQRRRNWFFEALDFFGAGPSSGRPGTSISS